MDFDKIYRDFEAARAVDDFETMSNIIAAVHKYCNEAGGAVPPKALNICGYVNVLIYRVTQLINDGDAQRAKAYLMALAANNVAGFDKFFHMLYLLGRALYATGDYVWAAKIFNRYEAAREAQFGDEDELSLFYRANCLKYLGDFKGAARVYEQALALKADFPEAEHNLQCNSTKNLLREVKTLWDFPSWQDVPIFINARDRLNVMRHLIDWLVGAGYRKLIILDNASTYPPLLEYYAALEQDPRIRIIRLGRNFGFKALWLSNVLERLKISTPYIYTDPDVLPIERCPKDFALRLMKFLDANHEVRKVGLGLIYDDITFFDKAAVVRDEADYYVGTRVGDNLHFAQVDTTLALYANTRHYSLRLSLRTTGDLRAYHLPWYFDYDNLPEDERYYLSHADKNSVTSLKKFWEG